MGAKSQCLMVIICRILIKFVNRRIAWAFIFLLHFFDAFMKLISALEVPVFIDIRGLRLSLKFCFLTLTRRIGGNIKPFHLFNRCRIIFIDAFKARLFVVGLPITVRLVRWRPHRRTSYFILAAGFLDVPIVGGIICTLNRKYTAFLLGFAWVLIVIGVLKVFPFLYLSIVYSLRPAPSWHLLHLFLGVFLALVGIFVHLMLLTVGDSNWVSVYVWKLFSN